MPPLPVPKHKGSPAVQAATTTQVSRWVIKERVETRQAAAQPFLLPHRHPQGGGTLQAQPTKPPLRDAVQHPYPSAQHGHPTAMQCCSKATTYQQTSTSTCVNPAEGLA
jgi:hypothetical protein